MVHEFIGSPDDPRLEPYRSVRDRDASGPDGRPGLFIGESPLVIEAMLRAPVEVLSILTAERHAARAEAMVASARAARPGRPDPAVLVAGDDVLDSVVGFAIHRGFLAVGRRPGTRGVTEVVPPPGVDALLLLVEEINNIDNIGQLFRNAAAFGCAAVILSEGCHDPMYRKSLRVSCGHALRVPFARSERWDRDIAWLRDEQGFAVLGMSGSGSMDLRRASEAVEPIQPRRLAVVVGAEFAGLRPGTLAACTHRVRIPMAAGVDSLNVGVAAGVVLARLSEGRSFGPIQGQ
ncbi:MAG: TrmH family RNA methyltransferase [Planctomycetota bacterium]